MTTAHDALLSGLSGRQRDCILRVKDGLTSKEIGRELGISHRTVEMHTAAAMQKLGVRNRYAVIALLHGEDLPSDREGSLMFKEVGVKPGDELVLPIDDEPAAEADETEPAEEYLPFFGGKPNDADRSTRIKWMIRVALFSVMATCFVILSALGLSQLASLS